LFDKLADQAKAAAKTASDYTKKTYQDLKAPPTSVQCSGCPEQVPVPDTLFDWQCDKKHSNKRGAEKCVECGQDKYAPPREEPKTVTCQRCNAVTPVPSTAAERHLKQAAYDTKAGIQKTATMAQESFSKMKSSPEEFHCSVCDNLLFVPKGQWMCQVCAHTNEENDMVCTNAEKQCTQKKSNQKVMCGVCAQPVFVPTSNFFNSLGHAERQMSHSVKKAFYQLTEKPNVDCPRCKKAVLIPDSDAEVKDSSEPVIITVKCQACQESIRVQKIKRAPNSLPDPSASSSSSSASSTSSAAASSTSTSSAATPGQATTAPPTN